MKDLITVVSHSSIEIREDFKSTVLREFNKGNITNQQFAIFIDKLLIEKTGYQKYGTQIRLTDDEVELLPVKDIDRTKEYRKEIGLMSLDKYFSMINSAYKKQR